MPEEFHLCIVRFILYVQALRLRKWGKAAMFYNQYVRSVNARRREFLERSTERRAIRLIPEGGR